MRISVLGAGWLGLPFAQLLIEKGHQVQVSKRSEEGVKQLQAQGLNAIQFDADNLLKDEHINLDNAQLSDFFNCDLLLITIPPALDKGEGSNTLN
ncbi:2-dehydropantoate 2-reductase N-terminal domain-containing protein [Catenovulum sediminis]|uniref:2-dehydropantoate 2-reductase N-terminal domain-containing protein n=1 Tax=Catenovulum sediminis TaxID=1740262 RepID=UPI00163D600E|nr:2-dehydropantoate 2-reductase N-terminal domain-containing protein [Catenovulum sediminis]